MPWTEITRPQYDRRGQRYTSDSTNEEWASTEPFMPPRCEVGRPHRTDMRSVREAIQYLAATGCQWALLPRDFPSIEKPYGIRMPCEGGRRPLAREPVFHGAGPV